MVRCAFSLIDKYIRPIVLHYNDISLLILNGFKSENDYSKIIL